MTYIIDFNEQNCLSLSKALELGEQIMRDFKRSHYSDGDDFRTFYVTNQIIERYLDQVADALAKVVVELKG